VRKPGLHHSHRDHTRRVRGGARQAASIHPRPGHELVQIEEVISRNERYEIVRKHGDAGAIAEQIADP
jgi:hypothetical protein